MILALVNRSSFRVHEYRWYWAGNVLVHITFLLQAVAMGWQMLEITGSAFQVGLVAFMYGLPLLVMSPFSGLVADRMKRQWGGTAGIMCGRASFGDVGAVGGDRQRRGATDPHDIAHPGHGLRLLRARAHGTLAQPGAGGDDL